MQGFQQSYHLLPFIACRWRMRGPHNPSFELSFIKRVCEYISKLKAFRHRMRTTQPVPMRLSMATVLLGISRPGNPHCGPRNYARSCHINQCHKSARLVYEIMWQCPANSKERFQIFICRVPNKNLSKEKQVSKQINRLAGNEIKWYPSG